MTSNEMSEAPGLRLKVSHTNCFRFLKLITEAKNPKTDTSKNWRASSFYVKTVLGKTQRRVTQLSSANVVEESQSHTVQCGNPYGDGHAEFSVLHNYGED